jgi:hypothetical protein
MTIRFREWRNLEEQTVLSRDPALVVNKVQDDHVKGESFRLDSFGEHCLHHTSMSGPKRWGLQLRRPRSLVCLWILCLERLELT